MIAFLETIANADVEPVITSARAISEYGILVVIAAFMLVFMFLILRYFLSMFQKMFDKMTESQQSSESTMEQVRVLQSVAFDLSKYHLLDRLHKIHKEGRWDDRDRIQKSLEAALEVIHNDRNAQFDNFRYHGYPLSYFCDEVWIGKMAAVGMDQLYGNTESFDYKAVFNVLDMAYNQIKIEFYNNVISKS